MKNKEMKVKAMSMAVAMSMVVGLCPSTIFAATGSQTAKDGTYTKTAHVTRTEDDSDDEWEEYDVEVSLKVEDGKFSEITVTPKEGYDEENASYFNKAYSKSKGFKTKLEGQAATEDTINSWDTVSGATRTSDAIKKAALEAIQSAPVAGETVTIDTAKLESAIVAAEKLTESDYTADSWSAMQTKLTAAKAALKAKESQSAVDTAADELNAAVKALEKADPKVLDEIDTLEQEYDRVCEKHADLWDKVDEAYFDLPDDYDFDNYEEAAFIRSLSFLTDAEKDALIADYTRLTEIDGRLCELYNSIWDNTGCESGICPFDGKTVF